MESSERLLKRNLTAIVRLVLRAQRGLLVHDDIRLEGKPRGGLRQRQYWCQNEE